VILSAKIYVMLFGFWGGALPPDPHRDSAPGPCWGTSVPQTPLTSPPQPLTPGDATGCAPPETEVWLCHWSYNCRWCGHNIVPLSLWSTARETLLLGDGPTYTITVTASAQRPLNPLVATPCVKSAIPHADNRFQQQVSYNDGLNNSR